MARVASETRGREARRFPRSTPTLPLDGTPVMELVHAADKRTAIRKARVIYVMAAAVTGSSYGVNVQIGTYAHPNKFTVHTTGASKALGAVDTISLAGENYLEADECLVVRTSYGKTGAGAVVVQFELNEVE